MKTLIPTLALVASFNATAADPIEATTRALEAVQRHVEQVQEHVAKQLAQAQRAVELAVADIEPPEPPEPPDIPEAAERFGLAVADTALDVANDVVGGIFGTSGRAAPAAPLIVRGPKTDAATVTRLKEDLAIMSRILSKAIARDMDSDKQREVAMGIFLSSGPSSRRLQNMYLEGYGALFLVNVRFPLVAPVVKKEETPEKPADTTWEEARREVFGGPDRDRRWKINRPTVRVAAYDPERVEELKKDLLEALKNAANLRDVKDDEHVVVIATGPSGGAVSKTKRVVVHKDDNEEQTFEDAPNDGEPAAVRRETTLTIRVKKSDVDDFAKGKLSLEQFQKKAQIGSY
ncbi:MAG: hypothetical protein HYY24_00590 [Verrucomicrobia bacterium]|nr:hypothetical protein [Verrucomicrobiota bacterium]